MSSTPPDDHPTRVIPQRTAEQPPMATAPATQRSGLWPSRLPQRIGRARTSTVIIGALFVLLGGLNIVLPEDPYVTVPTEYGDLRVHQSQLTRTPVPTPTAPQTPTTPAGDDPEPTTSATSSVPRPTSDATTTTPRTSSAPQDTDEDPSTSSRSSTTSSRATSTGSSDDAEPTGTDAPTS